MSYKSMEGPKVLEKFSISTNISSLVKRTVMCLVAQLCLTLCDPWTVAHQAPLSMEFSRQEHWSGLPFPSPKDRSTR